jgi:hypothetical protein
MIYNKGGKSRACDSRRVAGLVAPRRAYSNREKAIALSLVQEKMMNEGISLARAASEINVPHSSIYRWRADANLPDLSTDSSDIAEKNKNHQGPEGFLDDIKDELISFITEWRDRGLPPVSRFAVLQKATQYKPTFAEKSLPARYMCISHFLHANNMVHRIATHTSQKPPEVACEDASSYMKMIVPMCVGRTRNPKFTINMDQTNQFYGSSPKSTINVRGQRELSTCEREQKKVNAAPSC